jgi:hypothetical protein
MPAALPRLNSAKPMPPDCAMTPIRFGDTSVRPASSFVSTVGLKVVATRPSAL